MADTLHAFETVAGPESSIAQVTDVLTALSEQAARWQAELAKAQDHVRSFSDRRLPQESNEVDDRVLISAPQAASLVSGLLAAGARRIVHVHSGNSRFLSLRDVLTAIPESRRPQVRELVSRPTTAAPTAPGADNHRIRTTWAELRAMVIVDDVAALIPSLEADPALTVSVVRQRSVVGQLAQFFETAWLQSTPPDEPVRGCSEAEADLKSRIILLLAEGAKDETVARRLGISLRTCRRHVAEILGQLDASSRFQAGARAALLGMVPMAQPTVPH